ncbi:MAG TPA: hypothetical protein VF215_04810 [Thermoanaerobaculia bacterium]
MIETLNFALNDQGVSRLSWGEIFLAGASREQLVSKIAEAIAQGSQRKGEDTRELDRDVVVAALHHATFRGGSVAFEYIPYRDYESVTFPIADIAFALTPEFRARVLE